MLLSWNWFDAALWIFSLNRYFGEFGLLHYSIPAGSARELTLLFCFSHKKVLLPKYVSNMFNFMTSFRKRTQKIFENVCQNYFIDNNSYDFVSIQNCVPGCRKWRHKILSCLVHKWRHANLHNFWLTLPIVTLFIIEVLVLSSHNPWPPPP